MKILFLDMDGVLNNFNLNRERWPDDIQGELLAIFVPIIKQTDAKIVLSTSWRHSDELKARIRARFEPEGIWDRIIGQTPDYWDQPRGDEIAEWLKNNPSEEIRYAIVDDDEDAGHGHRKNFFHTNPRTGITASIAEKIIKHLNETPVKKKRDVAKTAS